MQAQPIRIGMLGLGTVGTGVAKLLLDHPTRIHQRAGQPVELARVLVRDSSAKRDVTLPPDVITTNVDDIINDETIPIALQLMGGIDPAREIMERLLRAGKDVVTANKALLCEHGDELFQLARELGRTIAFEGAVAGGIPIISAIGQSMSANQISRVEAILNGTSNYILTNMLADGRSYESVLKEAQQLGYAEADPAMDVDGTDAAQKLVILCRLAFGTQVSTSDFHCSGIDNLSLVDLEYAAEMGYTIKLVATAALQQEDLEVHVEPTLIRNNRPLALTGGAQNIVAIEGDAIGKAWFSGPGAGQMPTASAVTADLIDVVSGRAAFAFRQIDLTHANPRRVLPREQTVSRFYLRMNVLDRPHVMASVADILGRHEISLATIIQHEAPEEATSKGADLVPLVIMTHRTTTGQLERAWAEILQLDSVQLPCVFLAAQ